MPDEPSSDVPRFAAEDPAPKAHSARGYHRYYALVATIGLLVLLTLVFHSLQSVLKPLFVAVFLCYLIFPGVEALTRRGVNRTIAYIASVLLISLVLYGLGQLMTLSLQGFAEKVDGYQSNLEHYATLLTETAQRLKLLAPEQEINGKMLMSAVPKDWLQNAVSGGTSFFMGFVGNLLVIIFFMVFLLLEASRFPQRMRRAFGDGRGRAVLSVVKNINENVQRYIQLKVLVSAITGVLSGLIMFAFGLDFAVPLGFSVFLLNFIPYVGSILATFGPVVVALLQFPSALIALWIGLALAGVQTMMGNVIEPRIQGRSLNLSPLLILVSLAVWQWLWGPIGMVLAIPITAGIRILLEQFESTRPIAVLMGDVPDDRSFKPTAQATSGSFFGTDVLGDESPSEAQAETSDDDAEDEADDSAHSERESSNHDGPAGDSGKPGRSDVDS